MRHVPLADVSAEGVRVVTAAAGRGLTLRLVGGAAVAHRCPSGRHAPLAREYKDVDLVGLRRERAAQHDLLVDLGYEPNDEFNLLHGDARLLFWDPANQRQLDVLLDRFSMCHTLELEDRLGLDGITLPPEDLLLTKLQVRETNERDLKDALALLVDCEIDVRRIAEVAAADWGWWRTTREVLERVDAYAEVLDEPARGTARARVAAIEDAIAKKPKGLRWRARARLGDRVRWYEEPDEDY